MKYVIVSLFIVALASPVFLNPVEDKDSDAAKKYFNDLLDRLNNNLVQIRDGLLKDNKHMEVPAVELDRLALQQVSRPALVRTVDFVYNNRQYWKNATSLQLNKGDDENTTLKSFENLAVVLQKVHDGLNKDNKRVQAVLASVLKAATEKQVLPSVKSYFRLFEKYNHYVKP